MTYFGTCLNLSEGRLDNWIVGGIIGLDIGGMTISGSMEFSKFKMGGGGGE